MHTIQAGQIVAPGRVEMVPIPAPEPAEANVPGVLTAKPGSMTTREVLLIVIARKMVILL